MTGTRAPVTETDRVLATVLFTDIVGSTEKAAALGVMALCTKAFFVHFYKDTNPKPRRAPNTAHDQRSRAIVT